MSELGAVWPDFVGGRPTGLHKTRVASRRIREALPIVAAAAPSSKVKKLNRKMRALTRSLGPIRELDVELDMLERGLHAAVPDRALEILRREVASRRQALRKALADDAPIPDVGKLLKKLERIARSENGRKKTREAETAWRGLLATRLMRRAKALSHALDDAGPLYAPERLHEVRIATKKLRYALEIAHDAGVDAASPVLRTLKRHQERLGRLHDVQMLLKRVREVEALPRAGARVNDLAAYADALDRQCRRLHADFVERRAELMAAIRDVRHHAVPHLTTQGRRQARVAPAARPLPRTKVK